MDVLVDSAELCKSMDASTDPEQPLKSVDAPIYSTQPLQSMDASIDLELVDVFTDVDVSRIHGCLHRLCTMYIKIHQWSIGGLLF